MLCLCTRLACSILNKHTHTHIYLVWSSTPVESPRIIRCGCVFQQHSPIVCLCIVLMSMHRHMLLSFSKFSNLASTPFTSTLNFLLDTSTHINLICCCCFCVLYSRLYKHRLVRTSVFLFSDATNLLYKHCTFTPIPEQQKPVVKSFFPLLLCNTPKFYKQRRIQCLIPKTYTT